MTENELFKEAFEQAEQHLNTPGEDLRKQALALLLAADIQHRANIQAWLAVIVKNHDGLDTEERYDDVLHLMASQRDQGQISMLIENLLDLDFEVSLEPGITALTYRLVGEEIEDEIQQMETENRYSDTITKLNRLYDK